MDAVIAHGLKPQPQFRKVKKSYNIYKDPVTDDGTKKSLKGLLAVLPKPCDDDCGHNSDGDVEIDCGTLEVKEECTLEEENTGLLQVIYEDGKFYNSTSLSIIKENLNK